MEVFQYLSAPKRYFMNLAIEYNIIIIIRLLQKQYKLFYNLKIDIIPKLDIIVKTVKTNKSNLL